MGRRATGSIEARTTCIRLKFTHLGRRRVETLDLKPTPPNIRAAERLLKQIVAAIDAGIYHREDFFQVGGITRRSTFAEFADEWLGTLTIEHSTKRSYKGSLKAIWLPAFGEKTLIEIKPSDIKKAIADKAGPDAKKRVTGKTINNALIPLRQLFDAAIGDGFLESDPSAGIKNLKHQAPKPDPLTREETLQVLDHMHEHFPEQVRNYYDFAFHTGLRPSEQIVLRWPDIDWNMKTARISRARVEGVEKVTKTHIVRDVDLSDAALTALKRQKAFTFMRSPDGEIFHNPVTDRPWNSPQKQRILYWAPALRALGIRGRDAYQTRHTFATNLLMGSVNPAYIARQLGHTSAQMLFKVYGTWIEKADGGAEARKANALMGHNGGPALDEEQVG